MSTIDISTPQPTGYDIAGSDNLYHLLKDISVKGSIFGIHEDDQFKGNTVQIDGTVSGVTGVGAWGENTKVQVGLFGEVRGSAYGVFLNGAGESLLNAGTITGLAKYGVFLGEAAGNMTNNGKIVGGDNGVLLKYGNHEIVSNGGIEGTSKAGILINYADATIKLGAGSETTGNVGIAAEDGAGHHLSITNDGLISATTIGAIDTGDAKLKLANTGTIDGLVTSGAGADRVNNSGAIHGVVDTGAGKDVVVNSGVIDGYMTSVSLGDGNDRLVNHSSVYKALGGVGHDTFDTRGGAVTNGLYGGADNDTYLVSDASTHLVENTGEGIDTVKSTVSYLLSSDQELENLRLLGSKDIDGTGNALANRITGNAGDNSLSGLNGDDILSGGKGNDILTGGADADTFVFSTKFGQDQINDFEAGVDHIDLTRWNGVDSFKDMMSHHLSISGSDVVIHDGADYLTLHNVDKSELHASDFSF